MVDFSAWLRPTILGPYVVSWGLATMGSALGLQQVLGARFDSWLMAMLFASFFASAVVVLLLLADVALLKAKMRMLPSGQRAWTSSCLAPVATFGIWSVWPFPVDSVPTAVIGIVLPMIAAAFGVRFALGRRP